MNLTIAEQLIVVTALATRIEELKARANTFEKAVKEENDDRYTMALISTERELESVVALFEKLEG